ncbi:MAG TPA: FkbM family methyltransferase [Allosphingosinicella sp.]|nr:FkbM family methyltransferase [Allosphingosinicella sp.]
MSLLSLIEVAIGRRAMWKIGRRLYLHARREGSLDFERNGEAYLQRALAQHSAATDKALRIVDVGANYGQWSRAFLSTLRESRAPAAELILFEPVPAIADAVAGLAAEFPEHRIKLERCAVSDEIGTARMIMTQIEAGNHHLEASSGALQGEEIEVPVTTLDNYFDAPDHAIDIVKIDAEGFDPKVLAGMKSLLARHAVEVVQFEYSWLFIRSRAFLHDVFDLAHAHGYQVGLLTGRGVEIHPKWHQDLEKFNASAMVLLRDTAREWLTARDVRYRPDNTHD